MSWMPEFKWFPDGHFGRPDMWDGVRTAWRAECSCGWKSWDVHRGTGGRFGTAIRLAWEDLEEHARGAHYSEPERNLRLF